MMVLLQRLASLQARLLAMMLLMVTGVWLGAACLTWYEARHELDELLDSHLAQAAALLVVQQTRADSDGDDDDDVLDAPSLHKYAPKVSFQVFHHGTLMMRSGNAGLIPMATLYSGFTTVQLGQEEWRVFATHSPASEVQVYVGEQTTSRSAILWAVLRGVLLPMFFALPLLGLLLWWAVRQGLAPLRQLSVILGKRQPRDIAPVVLVNAPSEMQPLIQALNTLLRRIEHMLDSERRFTADAAHELRTPIAGIRAQAQVAMGAGHDAGQRQHALEATLAGCDRATRLVDQLLTLARLEATPTLQPCHMDLCELTRRVAANLAPLALAHRQSLELDAPVPCPVTGNDLLVSVLVRNLIDNALRYSPDGTRILVSVSLDSGHVTLNVQDSGPGMRESEMARLGERFFRVLGHEKPGSGLGWSIVQRIAEVFAIQMQVQRSQQLGGLSVSGRWPKASA
jgi:two-component system, OmpR family, sensor histidine kinase QseC